MANGESIFFFLKKEWKELEGKNGEVIIGLKKKDKRKICHLASQLAVSE